MCPVSSSLLVCIGGSDVALLTTNLTKAIPPRALDVLLLEAHREASISELAVAVRAAGSPSAVLLGAAVAHHAAALGATRRAARAPVRHYLLLDPTELPQTRVGDYDWPDAPVTVLLTRPSTVAAAAAMRGWTVCEGTHEDIAERIMDALA